MCTLLACCSRSSRASAPRVYPRADHHRPARRRCRRGAPRRSAVAVCACELFAALDAAADLGAVGARDRALRRDRPRVASDVWIGVLTTSLRRRLRHLADHVRRPRCPPSKSPTRPRSLCSSPMALTKLMLVGRRAPLDRTPARGRARVRGRRVRGRPTASASKGWFIPSGAAGRSPAVVFVHGWLWNRLGNVAGQVPVAGQSTSTSCPRPRRCTTPASTCCCSTCAATARASAAQAADLRPDRGARLHRRRAATCARARTSTASGSARSAPRWAATSSLYGTPDVPADQGDPGDPADAPDGLQHELRRDELGPLGPPMIKPIDSSTPRCARRGRASTTRRCPPRSSATPSSSTSRAPATRGARWTIVEEFAAVTPERAGPVIKFPSTGRYEGYRYVYEDVGRRRRRSSTARLGYL